MTISALPRWAVVGIAIVLAALAAVGTASAALQTDRAVAIGRDNDNADNRFIQPAGVAAKQHLDNTDVLLGTHGDDLLVGRLGGDTIDGAAGADILVGGPEAGQAPNSDVLLGGPGDDINIWAPGDGSDAFVGGSGHDTMVFAPFVLDSDGELRIVRRHGRRVPLVDIDDKPQFRCTVTRVPQRQRLGFDFVARFFVGDTLAVTVRQEAVERVLCPGAAEGEVEVADLTDAHPRFITRRLANLRGATLRDIVQAH